MFVFAGAGVGAGVLTVPVVSAATTGVLLVTFLNMAPVTMSQANLLATCGSGLAKSSRINPTNATLATLRGLGNSFLLVLVTVNTTSKTIMASMILGSWRDGPAASSGDAIMLSSLL